MLIWKKHPVNARVPLPPERPHCCGEPTEFRHESTDVCGFCQTLQFAKRSLIASIEFLRLTTKNWVIQEKDQTFSVRHLVTRDTSVPHCVQTEVVHDHDLERDKRRGRSSHRPQWAHATVVHWNLFWASRSRPHNKHKQNNQRPTQSLETKMTMCHMSWTVFLSHSRGLRVSV